MKRTTHTILVAGVLCACIGLVQPVHAANWTRDFNDGTLQNLKVFDYAVYLAGIVGFTPYNSNGVCRMQFLTHDINPFDGTFIQDIGAVYDTTNTFTDTTAKVLLKWSANPMYTDPGKDMTVGLLVRLDFTKFNGYLIGLTDEGDLAISKLVNQPAPDFQELCPEPDGKIRVADFDVTKDWWMRAEAVNVIGGVKVHGRIWLAGTEEPTTWQVECLDAAGYASGGVGVIGQEKEKTTPPNRSNYIDIDDLSARVPPEWVCYDNIDNDGNGLTDCADPACAGTAACQCHDPFADIDGDGDVDQVDFGLWQLCFTGPNGLGFDAGRCECLDRDDKNGDHLYNPPDDGDGDVDMDDFAKFAKCYSGPGVPADKACDNVN